MGIDQNVGNGSSADTGHQKLMVVLASLLVAQVVASNHTSIAKVILFLTGQSLTCGTVAAMSLNVIYFFACVSICLGAFAAKRRWVSFEQVVFSLIMAVFVASLVVVDQKLQVENGNGQFRFTEKLYYLGWIIGLWVSPFFLLLRPDGVSQKRIRSVGGLLYVSVGMCLAGFVAGFLVEGMAHLMDKIYPPLMEDSQAFWIARPIAINAIGCAFAVVAFSGIWWRGFWRSATYSRIWSAGMIAFATIYSGIYGSNFDAKYYSADSWQPFLSFAALPASVALVVLTAYRLTRQECTDIAIGWPVSKWFWWLLPTGFAVALALIACFGLAPLGDKREWDIVLVVAHGINGVFLGLTFRLMPCIFKLIPDGQRMVVPREENRGRC